MCAPSTRATQSCCRSSTLATERMSGSEALLRALRAMGVERIFASPGSDWAPLWEALARPWKAGEVPEYISSRHEETAVGMASGYAKATGKLPAVVIHTTVGALHASMALRAALHERIPMVVLAGESVSFGEPLAPPAGRQWLRVLTDVGGPAALVERSVKWSFGLNSSLILPHTIQRACQLAMSATKGRVSASGPTKMLMETMSAEPPIAALPAATVASDEAIAELATALGAAKRPGIVSEELGRYPAAVGALVRVAEALGAPVLDGWHADYVNFPRTHPLYAGIAAEPLNPLLRESDFVLLAEAVAPWHPATALTHVPVAALGEDPLHSRLPFWGFRTDHVLPGDAEASLRSLAREVKGLLKGQSRKGTDRNPKRPSVTGDGKAITAAWAAQELNAVWPKGALHVNETIS